jgi:acetophenone carboxylase
MADITPELNATGCGARSDMDGVDCAGSYFATMSDCSDVETTELDRPFLYLFRNYFKTSYGHGKYRGGAGVGLGLMMHHVPWVAMGSFGYGSKFPSTMGIFGGYAVPPIFIKTVHGSNVKKLLAQSDPSLPVNTDQMYMSTNPEEGHSELSHITMHVTPFMNGETLYLQMAGGAGYGDVLEREPASILKDIRDGRTTHWAAQNIYKVVYDEQTLRLDPAKTASLREEARAERKRRGKRFAEFEAEWLKLRPGEQAIKYYGSYPYPNSEKTN